ncbi:efflux RND transporter periplasmic adaptor subunit [Polyangium sp. 15x6]|uniref:efflux RND transporter periplasmic adaptor subunit n=1 Tax=Polyangium sp. 15x6 TaxID=3042687 RepID=UPI00249B389C|nr:efflux RND transporter periplasmic adaptor subunit [Polyangium sp. 15x6]MDI3285505.1 efflux RND transporter periplasmic adaptor subunit [Polyangium sp. 15x6]
MMRLDQSAYVAALALLLSFTPSCARKSAEQKAKPAESATAEPAPAVKFAKVTERKLSPTLELTGTLAADETSEVAAATSGIVTKVVIDVGTRVKKGDILVQLDSSDPALRAQAADASAAQALAKLGVKKGEKFDPNNVAEVRAAKESMDLAVSEADRTKKLYEGGSVAASQWDQARSRAEQARAQYEAALNGAAQGWAGLAAAQSQANLARKSVADTSIRAPFDGAVAERRATVGEFAPMGKVIAVVVRDETLRLRIDVPETDASKVTIGKEVTLTVSAHPGKTFKGLVKRVGASLKAQSRTLPIEAEVANGDGLLKPGYFARAYVELGETETNALFVPRAAIGSSGSANRVFVRSGNRVVERIVTLGREIDGEVEIRGNVLPTDEVATERVDLLQDGVDVNVAPASGAK